MSQILFTGTAQNNGMTLTAAAGVNLSAIQTGYVVAVADGAFLDIYYANGPAVGQTIPLKSAYQGPTSATIASAALTSYLQDGTPLLNPGDTEIWPLWNLLALKLYTSNAAAKAAAAAAGPRTLETAPNAISAGNAKTPPGLTMRVVSRQRSVDPWPDDRFLILNDDFMDVGDPSGHETGHKVAALSGTVGTFSIQYSAFNLAATNGAWNAAVYPRCRVVAPYFYLQARVKNAVGCGASLGIAKDANNAAGMSVDPNSGQPNMFAVVNGVAATFSAPAPFALPSSDAYEMMCVISFPEVWGYLNFGNGWVCCGYTTFPGGADLRNAAEFKQWLPFFGSNMTGSGQSISFSELQLGYVGGIGTRDYKPITYKDGTPYRLDGRIWVTTTCATGYSWNTNHMAVMSLDPVTYHARLESHLFFRWSSTDPTNPNPATRDLVTSFYGGQVVYDSDADQWEFLINTWGLQNSDDNGIKLVRCTTAEDILHGVHLLDAWQVVMPTLNGNVVSHYDDTFRWDAATNLWRMCCIESENNYPVSSRAPALFTSPDLANWTRIASRHDLDNLTLDGTVGTKIGNAWYYFAGGNTDYYQFNAADLSGGTTLPSWKNFDGAPVFAGFPPHACPIPLCEGGHTRYVALTYDSTYLYPVSGFGKGTSGALVVLEADELVTGNEFPLRRSLRYGR